MKDYKQQLKEKLMEVGSTARFGFDFDKEAFWQWLEPEIDELEAKTRRESVEGFVKSNIDALENARKSVVNETDRKAFQVRIDYMKSLLSTQSNDTKPYKSWKQTLIEGNEEGKE